MFLFLNSICLLHFNMTASSLKTTITTGLFLHLLISSVTLLPLKDYYDLLEDNGTLVTVHPSDLSAITLQAGQMTTGYRSAPVPQLKCTQGTCSQTVTTVQCYNRGLDGHQHIQWECQTKDLPDGYDLQVITVTCEGYPNADSPDIIADSCGLEYGVTGSSDGGGSNGNGDAVFWTLIALTVFGLVITVICCIVCMLNRSTHVYPVGGPVAGGIGYPVGGYGGYGYPMGYGGYYGGGGDGFGTGMMTGYMLGGGFGRGGGWGGGGCSSSFGGGGGGSFGGGHSGGHMSSGFAGTRMR